MNRTEPVGVLIRLTTVDGEPLSYEEHQQYHDAIELGLALSDRQRWAAIVEFAAARLVSRGDSENVDFVRSLRELAEKLRQ